MSLGYQEDREAEQVYPEHSWLVVALVWLTWEQHPEILLGSGAVLTDLSVSYFNLRSLGLGSISLLLSVCQRFSISREQSIVSRLTRQLVTWSESHRQWCPHLAWVQ